MKPPTWRYESRAVRRARDNAKLLNIQRTITPMVLDGSPEALNSARQVVHADEIARKKQDFLAQLRNNVKAQVTGTPTRPKPPVKQPKSEDEDSGGGGFLGALGDVAGDVAGGVKDVYSEALPRVGQIIGTAATLASGRVPTGRQAKETAENLSTSVVPKKALAKIPDRPYVPLRRVVESVTSPLGLATAGLGAEGAAANVARNVLSVGTGEFAHDVAEEHLPDELNPGGLTATAAGLIGGAAAFKGAGHPSETAESVNNAIARAQGREGLSPALGMGLEDVSAMPGAMAAPTRATAPVRNLRENVPDLFDLKPIEPRPLSRVDNAMNAVKDSLGMNGTRREELARPAVDFRRTMQPVIKSQAQRLATKVDATVVGAFERDKLGRITTLPGAPTVQDLAAKLPQYDALLTPAQKSAMESIRAEVEPYGKLLDQVGIDIHSRPDIVDGGFYLPRGRADLEGMDGAIKVGSGGRKGGKASFEKGATFDSMTQALDTGKYEYAPLAEALASYGNQAGNRIVDMHVTNYLKGLTDDSGGLIGQTAADRVPTAIRAQYQDAVANLASIRDKLATAERRAGVAAGTSDELDNALQSFARATPTGGTSGLAKVGSAVRAQAGKAEGLQERAAGLEGEHMTRLNTPGDPVRVSLPATEAQVSKAELLRHDAGTIQALNDRLAKLIPDDVERVRYLDSALLRTAKRTETLAQRGGKWANVATGLRNELDNARQTLADVTPAYKKAVEAARSTPRGQGTIALAPLNGMTFPDALANVMNAHLNAEGPLVGRGASTVRAVNAANTLLRGLKATGDASFMGIQGAIGAATNPVAYGKALAIAYKAMADPQALGKYIQDFDQRALAAGKLTSRDWATAGLHLGGAETEFSVGKGLTGALGRTASLPVIKQSNRAFGYFGDVLRLELADATSSSALLHGFDLSDVKQLQSIAHTSNLVTGWSANRFGGDLGELATFAPRFLQSQLELLTKVATAGVGDAGALQARRAMLQFAGVGVGLSVLANETSDEKIPWNQFWDPTGSNFLRFRVLGQDHSLFGPWDSLLRNTVAISKGGKDAAAALVTGDVSGAGGALKSPLMDFYRSKASPVVSAGWDLFSGKTFTNDDVTPGSFLANLVVPFSASDIAKKAADADLTSPAGVARLGLQTGTSLAGLKSSPMTATEQLDTVALLVKDPETGKANGKPFYDSTPAVQKLVKDDHPDLWQRAVEAGSQKRQMWEGAKNDVAAQQKSDDELLLSGQLSRDDWAAAAGDRRTQLRGQQLGIYGDTPPNAKDPVLRDYYAAIDAATVNGRVNWDAVDGYTASLSDADRQHIATNSGLTKTPLQRLRASLQDEYYNLPVYKGFTAGQGQAIDDALVEVRNRARNRDGTLNKPKALRALRQYAAEAGLDEETVKGVRRAIYGRLVRAKDRDRWVKAHPESVIFRGSGTLLPEDVAAVQGALSKMGT